MADARSQLRGCVDDQRHQHGGLLDGNLLRRHRDADRHDRLRAGAVGARAPLCGSHEGRRVPLRPPPHSATAQFFINVADNDFLNFRDESLQGWGYCVFAEVVEGMDVVNAIKAVKTGRSGMHQDVPKDDVVIQKVTVSE